MIFDVCAYIEIRSRYYHHRRIVAVAGAVLLLLFLSSYSLYRYQHKDTPVKFIAIDVGYAQL